MRRVDKRALGILDALKPDAMGMDTGQIVVLTVSHAELQGRINQDTTQREGALVVEFEEYPDLGFWPNRTSSRNLLVGLGDDLDAWPGARVPLKAVTSENPQTGESANNLWVLQPRDWAQHLPRAERAAKAKRTKKAAKKTAKRTKKTAKRSRR